MAHYILRFVGEHGRQIGRAHFMARGFGEALEIVETFGDRTAKELWCGAMKLRSWAAGGEPAPSSRWC